MSKSTTITNYYFKYPKHKPKCKYYAVKNGRVIGIFKTWEECKQSVEFFSGAVYKSFTSLKEAENYIYSNDKPIMNNLLKLNML